MKKIYLSIFVALLSLFSGIANARTIYVASTASVADSVSNAVDGDIVELTTSGGTYSWSKTVNITTEKSITVRAAQGLAAKPLVVWSAGTYVSSSNYFFRYYPSTCTATKTLSIQGIDFNGKNLCYYFLYCYTPTTNGQNIIIDNCVIRNIYSGGRTFYFSNYTSYALLSDLTVTNTEFRNAGGNIFYGSSSYNMPSNLNFSNCLFLSGPNTNTSILIYSSAYNNLKIDHCTFLKSNYNDIYAYSGTGSVSIKNSIFAYNNSGSSSYYGSASLGSDCGVYTNGGSTTYMYPNSTAALQTDPLIQVADSSKLTGYAAATAYQTGSTDGKPIGYYRTTSISTSTTKISGLDYLKAAGPSTEQSVKVSGYGLSEDITITPSANFEISKTSGASFGSSAITLTQTSGTVSAATVYVRLKASLSDSTYTGKLTLTSKNATTMYVSLSGSAINKATIQPSATSLTGFKYATGTGPSAEQAFTVSGVNLSSTLNITAPSNYEISPLSGTSFIALSSIPIAQSGGVVNPTTIYVRLKAGLAISSYNQSITLTSSGAVTKNIKLTGAVTNPPTINLSKSSISKLCYFYSNYTSTVDSLVISGTDLNGGITLTPPSYFQISTSSKSGFVSSSSSLTLPLSGTGVSSTTIYVRIDPSSYYTGSITGNISVASAGITSKTIALSGYGYYNMPSTAISTTTLSGYKYFSGSGPSTEQSFTVSGNYLTDNIVITAPTDYEISTTTGTSFSGKSVISLVPSYLSVSTTTIYVRMKAGLSGGNYNENISVSTPYTTPTAIAVSGTVSNIPTIIASASSFTGMDYKQGKGPSVEKSFTVSGIDLTSIILVSAPNNFEISTSTGTDFSPTSQLILSQSSGIASTTTIYVRLKAGLSTNNYTGNISLISTNATIQYVSCNGKVTLLDAVNNPLDSNIKVYGSSAGIVIDGSTAGDIVSIYNMSGQMLYTGKSEGNKMVIPVQKGGVYIVKLNNSTLKVVL